MDELEDYWETQKHNEMGEAAKKFGYTTISTTQVPELEADGSLTESLPLAEEVK